MCLRVFLLEPRQWSGPADEPVGPPIRDDYLGLSRHDCEVTTANPTLAQRTQNICITLVERWTSVEDAGPTLYKCYTNALCLLGAYLCCLHYFRLVHFPLNTQRRYKPSHLYDYKLASGTTLCAPRASIFWKEWTWSERENIALGGFLHHHGNIRNQKPGLCSTVISNDFNGSL